MQLTRTKTLSETQFQQINALWNSSYPVPLKDRFGILLNGCSDYNHYVLEDESGTVTGWAVNFVTSGENRFSIIVHPGYKGKGLGKQLIQLLRADHDALYGWVIDHNEDIKEDGTPYISPLPFYEQLGCTILADQRLDTELIRAVKVKL